MNRFTFLKNFAAITGGGIILSCKNEYLAAFLEPDSSGILTLKEAQTWFMGNYIKKYENKRTNSDYLHHKRIPNWDEAKEIKTTKESETNYILVPIKYEDTKRPSFMSWNDETAFRTKLTQYFTCPIFEALIIHTDNKGNKEAYLSQIAYDRFHLKDGIFNLDTFTGALLKSEWDDTLIEGRCYSQGKHELTLNPQEARNRITDCDIYYFTYYTYDGHSCGVNCYEFQITEHRTYFVSCSGGGGGSGYPYAAPGGGGGFGGGSGEGGFNIPEFAPNTTNYELKKAICNPGGIDRVTMNNNLANSLTALGIFSGVTSLSNSMIEALVKSIGGSNQSSKIVQTVLGKTIGHVTMTIGVVDAILGVVDGDISNDDMLDILEAATGVGVVLTGGWLAVGLATVSVGIAIYQTANTPSCD